MNEPAVKHSWTRALYIVLGVLETLWGLMCALLAVFSAAGMFLLETKAEPGAYEIQPGAMIAGVIFYVLLAVWFIWLGIGSIRMRRWARALLLVSSWLFLVTGVMSLISSIVLLPDLYAKMAENGQLPTHMVSILTAAAIGTIAILYILFPGLLILFYGSGSARRAAEMADIKERWTDRCPLQVLAVSLAAAAAAAALPMMAGYNWALPLFGVIIDGAAGALVSALLVGLLLYVAVGMYRRKTSAWYASLVLITAWLISLAVTFAHVPISVYYEKMGMPAEQVKMMEVFTGTSICWMFGFAAIWTAVVMGWLFYIRRFFTPEKS